MRRCRIESLGVSPPGRSLLRKGALAHALTAGRRCLKASHYHPNDVRVLINTGVHRDGHVCEPAIAAYIQHHLQINIEFQGRRTLAFDLLNGACGMLNGMHLLSSLMQAQEIHAGMVISSEANSDRRPDPGYHFPASGAAVLLDLSPKNDIGFGAFAFHTDERQAELVTSTVSLATKNGHLLWREQAGLEAAYLAGASPAVASVLAKDGLRLDDIDLVIPAQVSAPFLERLPHALGIAPERVLDLTATLADTHSTSVVLALKQAQDAGRLPPKTKAVLIAFGSGITVAAATYHF